MDRFDRFVLRGSCALIIVFIVACCLAMMDLI